MSFLETLLVRRRCSFAPSCFVAFKVDQQTVSDVHFPHPRRRISFRMTDDRQPASEAAHSAASDERRPCEAKASRSIVPLTIAVLVFILLAPLLIIIVGIVRLSGPGSILVERQLEGDPGSSALAFRIDNPRSRIGSFLIATRLAELPTLFTSFILPRGGRPSVVEAPAKDCWFAAYQRR